MGGFLFVVQIWYIYIYEKEENPENSSKNHKTEG